MFGLPRKKESLLLRMDRLGEVTEVAHAAVQLSDLDPGILVGGLVYDFIEHVFEQPEADQIINKIAEALHQGVDCELAHGTSALEGDRLVFRQTADGSGTFDLLLVGSAHDKALSEQPVVNTPAVGFKESTFIERTKLYIVRTDPNFRITEVYGDVEGLVGIPSDRIFFDINIWTQILRTREARKLVAALKSQVEAREAVEAEIEVNNIKTGGSKWIMLKALPLFGKEGEHLGWEAIGIDSTHKKESELRLRAQGRRLEALYKVSRSTDMTQDASKVALEGLKALLEALPAASYGLVILQPHQSQALEVSAASGIGEQALSDFENRLGYSSVVREAMESGKLQYFADLDSSSDLLKQLVGFESARSIVLAPLIGESRSRARGLLILASHRRAKFSDLDLDLISAVTRQLSLVIRQAEYYSAERQQVSSLGALYQLSHELSQVFTARDIGEHAFPIIQEQIPCKRIWFGTVNENATHVAGEAGFGPGMRTRLINIQIELGLRHDFFDDALRTKQAVIVAAGTEMECSGLNRIIARLEIGTIVLIPLVSLGKVVGMLVIEPIHSSPEFLRGRLPLLSSMASEIASVVYARKFESKVADAQKMRMAGLLASGMAHNFNNLLQAILGQAQLLELELLNSPKLREPVKTIVSAGTQGARLLRQLISMTEVENTQVQDLSVKQIVNNSYEFYRSLLPENVEFFVRMPLELPTVSANSAQIQQVLSNLILNARDAVQSVMQPRVDISATVLKLSTGEIDPELAPGKYIRLDIEDNGIGMTPDQITRCFEPFYTTKNWDPNSGVGVSGAGLGLSISYSIIKRFGGLLTVSSRPGDGAIFSIYLPVSNNTQAEVSNSEETFAEISESFSMTGEKPLRSPIIEKIIDSDASSVPSSHSSRSSSPSTAKNKQDL